MFVVSHCRFFLLLRLYLLVSSVVANTSARRKMVRQSKTGVSIEVFHAPLDPIGTSDFYELRVQDSRNRSTVYVDKSMFLRDFLKSKEKITRITRPNSWGKSTNLNMVRRFLEIQLNATDRTPLPKERCFNYKLFAGGEIIINNNTNDNNNINNNTNTNNNNKQTEVLDAVSINRTETKSDNCTIEETASIDNINIIDNLVDSKTNFDNDNNRHGRLLLSLKPLSIAEHDDVMQHQCGYPVIYVSFERIVGSAYEEIETKLKKTVSDLYNEHSYLRDGLDLRYVNDFDGYLSGDFDRFELEHSLLLLSRLMYARFKRYVYVLIDDYDRPTVDLFYRLINQYRRWTNYRNSTVGNSRITDDARVYLKMSDSYELFKVTSLVEAIIGECLKNNRVLKQGLVKGVYDISMSLFTGVNQVVSYSLLDQSYSDYYGFTDNELSSLLNDRINNNNSHNNNNNYYRNLIRSWYGYNILGYPIYNPYSVRCWLANGRIFDYYWKNNVTSSIVDDILSSDAMQDGLQNLTGAEIRFNDYRTKIHFDFMAGDFKALLFAGYLNPTLNGFTVTNLSVPNREIERAIKEKMTAWVCDKFYVRVDDLAAIASLLAVVDVDKFKERLETLVRNGRQPNATDDRPAVRTYYNGLMKSLSFFWEENYRVMNNKIFDPFKPNLILVSKSPEDSNTNNNNNNNNEDGAGQVRGRLVVMIDYKVITSKDNLKAETNIAWQKICGKVRHDDLIGYLRGAKRVLKLVLVFRDDRRMGSEYAIAQ